MKIEKDNKIKDVIAGSFINALLPGIFLGTYIAFIFGISAPKEVHVVLNAPLVSMKNIEVNNGSFFLFTGSVKQTPYYEYYAEHYGNIYEMGRVNLDKENIFIIETDDAPPSVKITKTTLSPSHYSWVFAFDGDPKYEFKVPKGSVKKGFSIG